MLKDRSRLGYCIGALLLPAGVLLLCLFSAPPVFACAVTLVSAASATIALSVIGKRPPAKLPVKAALGAGAVAGAGLMLLLTAFSEEPRAAALSPGFVPVFTGLILCLLRKEAFPPARGLCLLAVLAGTALALCGPGFSLCGMLAAALFALMAAMHEKKGLRGAPRLCSFPAAVLAAGAAALLTGAKVSISGISPASAAGPVLIGAGYAFCRHAVIRREDAVWLRAAVPFLILYFPEALFASGAALTAAFLIPAGGAFFKRITHKPARYETGEEIALLNDGVPVCFYNGVLCLRHPLRRFTSCAGFGYILLNSNRCPDRRYHARPDTVKHEYGHILQSKALGPFRFWRFIALPSMRGYFTKVPYTAYYNQPWERGADHLGGVIRASHSEDSLSEWESYFRRILPKSRRAQYINEGNEENDQISE